jgi:hypothetical protein
MLRLKQLWKEPKKLAVHIIETNAKRVLLPFGHGLGDQIMFLKVFEHLQNKFPDVRFTLALQNGLGFQEIDGDIPGPKGNVIYVNDLGYNQTDVDYGYDIIADIDFPMNEGQTELTKGQFCCIHELGIEPNEEVYAHLHSGKNRIIAVQFHITCLPGACNPDRDVAEQIWNDILSEGYIPIEMHFQHVFHNPVNQKFDFIDSTVRRVQPRISTLIGLVEQAAGVVSVVTGNLHVALANKEPERIFFLEKDFKLESFIKNNKIARANVREYKGEVKEWLKKLEAL